MALPLKKTIYITAVFIAVFLGLVLTLGIRQYQLYKGHEEVTVQTEKLIFQFVIIREHVTESLLEARYEGLAGVADEVEELNSNLSRILANKHIADEYKLNFVSSIDLPGIVLLLRKIETGPFKPENLRQLNSEIRTLGERLVLFDRLLVNHAKRKLIGFQNIVIGALAIVVFIVMNVLLLFHKQVLTPLMRLVRQVKEVAAGKRSSLPPAGKIGEISELSRSFSELLLTREQTSEGLVKYQRILAAVRQVQNVIAHSKTREGLFNDICRTLLMNSDFCLVWIGLPEEDGLDLMPVSADGSTTMTNKERESCMAVLLTSAEEKGLEDNPSAQALQSGKPVINRDILADIPKGLLKGTPLADGHASCAALPVRWHGITYGVLSIYSSAEDSFNEKDMELLESMCADIALVLYSFDTIKLLERQSDLNTHILEAVEGVLVTISADGSIANLNTIGERLSGYSAQEVYGKNWQEFLKPVATKGNNSDNEQGLLESLTAVNGIEMIMACKGGEKRPLFCRFNVGEDEQGKEEQYVCVGRDITDQKHTTTAVDAARNSRFAVIGELATGVAHEINDLTNGVINYAQILADDGIGTDQQNEHEDMPDRIIDAGERIAGIVRKLIFYGQGQSKGGEYLPVTDVLSDSLLLVGYHLKNEGVRLDLQSLDNLPLLPVKAQHMLQIFLNLFNNARRSLNKRYQGKDANKRLEIKGDVANREGQKWLRLSFTDSGAGIDPKDIEKVLGSEFNTKTSSVRTGHGLSVSRDMLHNYGGELSIESEVGEYTTVHVDLPLG